MLASAGRGDWIACQITSNSFADHAAIQITDGDFTSGGLSRVSYARPGKLFTASESIIIATAGTVKQDTLDRVREGVIDILSA